MAYIKKVSFNHVKKEEGCMCDNCGQWITNIITVDFKEGESLRFGVDCYDKRINGKLNAYGKKEMNRIMKQIKEHSNLLNDLQSGKNTALVQKKWESYQYWQAYWSDKTIEDWKPWMIGTVTKWLEMTTKNLKNSERSISKTNRLADHLKASADNRRKS